MIFETSACTGCQSCELACSYHHMMVFGQNISSIHVLREKEKLGFSLSISGSSDDGYPACDSCEELDEPFCVKYCSLLMRKELKETLRKFRETKNDG